MFNSEKMENDGDCCVLSSPEGKQGSKFHNNREVYEGFGKLVAYKKNRCKADVNLCTEEEFFKSIVSIGCNSSEICCRSLLNELASKFSGMDREEVCLKILNSIETYSKDAPMGLTENSLQTLEKLLRATIVEIQEKRKLRCRNDSSSMNDSLDSLSSLGILDLSDLSSLNNESYEAVAEESFSDPSEFHKEIADLNHRNRRISDENKRFKSQIAASEELNQTLTHENDKLRKDIKNLQQRLSEISELERKNEDLRSSLTFSENSEKVLLVKLNELDRKNNRLEADLKDISEKLHLTQNDAEAKQANLKKSMQSMANVKNEMSTIQIEKEELEAQLDKIKVENTELKKVAKELTDTNDSLLLDNSSLKSEANLYKERLVENTIQLQSISSVDSSPVFSPQLRKNSITSTPVHEQISQESICSEVDALSSPKNLPNPFCGKPIKKPVIRTPVNRRSQFPTKKSHDSNRCDKSPSTVKNSSAEIRRKKFSQHLKLIDDGLDKSSKEDSTNLSSPPKNSPNRRPISKSPAHSSPKTNCKIKEQAKLPGKVSPKAQIDDSHRTFLEHLFTEIKSHAAYVMKVNVQAKEALQIDFDSLKLEKESLDVKEGSLELKIDSKAAGDTGMPPNSVAECNDKMISDLTTTDIREQISAEIKALKTQLVRSHALLSYLQEKEKYSSTSFTPDRFNPKTNGQRGKNHLQQQKSFDAHTSSYFPHYHKDSVSTASHRSTPLHLLSHRAQSCPTFLDDLSFASKSTQTETSRTEPTTFVAPRFVPVLKAREPRYSDYSASTSEVSSKSADNLECGVCEVHPIVEEEDRTASPRLPRHRTNSFLTAIVQTSESASPDVDRCDPMQKESLQSQHASRRSSFQRTRVVKIIDDEVEEKPKSSMKQECSESKCNSSTVSEPECERSRSEKEKLFKTSQRSLRRGSGAGSPNSLTSIPRVPAFDLDEQDEEHTLSVSIPSTKKTPEQTVESTPKVQDSEESSRMQTKELSTSNLKENIHVRQEPTNKAMLMPEVENSETESAKGSFEIEMLEAPSVASEIITSPAVDTAFPSLSNTILQQLGIVKDNPLMDTFNEQELENKFNALALIFKTDRITLSKRLDIQKRQRDIAEKDVENEIKSIRASLHYLNLNAQSSETRDLIAKIQTHIDIVSLATSKVSARSETYGAVKQEGRVSGAFEVMLHYAEHLRRQFDKEHKELEEKKRILSDVQAPSKKFHGGPEIIIDDHHKRSLKTLGLALGTVKSIVRRASVADFHHHSLQDGVRLNNLSHSWASGIKDTTNRLVGVFSPFSSLTSVGVSSSSSSTTVRPVATLQLPEHPSSTGTNRRCSLPVTPSSSLGGLFSSNPLFHQPEAPLNNKSSAPKDSKISVAPKLSSVADEEPTNDEDVDESESPEENRTDNGCADVSKTSYDVLRLIAPRRRYHFERNSDIEDFTDSSEEITINIGAVSYRMRAVQILERLGILHLQQVWNETSTPHLLRYFLSLIFAFGAIAMFFHSIS